MVRNRGLLIEAARTAFAERGVDVSIGEIAQRAGVAKGTVFRHFATKEDLLAAIMLDLLGRLIATADGLRDADDAGEALRELMTDGVEALAADQAFCDVVGRPSLQNAEVRAAIDHFATSVEALTARARHQGAIRDDVTGTDIVLLLGGIHQTAAPVLDAHPDAWRRYLALVFDGLSPVNAKPLPHPLPKNLQSALAPDGAAEGLAAEG
jgi:AcrR family transcriptional regulator